MDPLVITCVDNVPKVIPPTEFSLPRASPVLLIGARLTHQGYLSHVKTHTIISRSGAGESLARAVAVRALGILLAGPLGLAAQPFVELAHPITTSLDLPYGTATDFQGADLPLTLDLSLPTGDDPPACGRPLMVVVHGGAWYGGDKADGYAAQLREDFARRGYVAASVSYRQGLFNTERQVDCVLEGWRCWNAADTTEWYRANYRAMQDVRTAIQSLVEARATYNLDPDRVFVVGESAGGFVAIAVGFVEDSTEVDLAQVGALPDARAPHPIYEDACIRRYGLATSIAAMNLARPALGGPTGASAPGTPYRIRGVGNLYGGAFGNVFATRRADPPALYLYHQPCDLIVPATHNRLLAGYSACASGFPTFCQPVINRPYVYGSFAIAGLIDDLRARGVPTCDYLLDRSPHQSTCLEQVANPATGCHAIDDYTRRTTTLARYFADQLGTCVPTGTTEPQSDDSAVVVFPNPAREQIDVRVPGQQRASGVRIVDVLGRVVLHTAGADPYTLDVSVLPKGRYTLVVEFEGRPVARPIALH